MELSDEKGERGGKSPHELYTALSNMRREMGQLREELVEVRHMNTRLASWLKANHPTVFKEYYLKFSPLR